MSTKQQLEQAHVLVSSTTLQMVDISDHIFDDLFQSCYAELQQNLRAKVEIPASHWQRRIEIHEDTDNAAASTSAAPSLWDQRIFHWQHLFRLEILDDASQQHEVIDLTGEE